ncbi:MAG: hypothetical protein M1833_007239 [Piccolia ochrophora]|nr:MAG: hypothetical protein M1833_007239 [Piccolia ochrophora]
MKFLITPVAFALALQSFVVQAEVTATPEAALLRGIQTVREVAVDFEDSNGRINTANVSEVVTERLDYLNDFMDDTLHPSLDPGSRPPRTCAQRPYVIGGDDSYGTLYRAYDGLFGAVAEKICSLAIDYNDFTPAAQGQLNRFIDNVAELSTYDAAIQYSDSLGYYVKGCDLHSEPANCRTLAECNASPITTIDEVTDQSINVLGQLNSLKDPDLCINFRRVKGRFRRGV